MRQHYSYIFHIYIKCVKKKSNYMNNVKNTTYISVLSGLATFHIVITQMSLEVICDWPTMGI